MATKKKAADASDPLKDVLAQINNKLGAGTVMQYDKDAIVPVDVIPSGSITLDVALGVGGWARGRIIELFGNESGGKTTVALHAIAEAQKQGLVCAFIDAEHALDPTWAQKLGVDVESLLVSQPDCGEDALEVADMLTRSGQVGVIVIDSVAALTPRAELEGEMGQSHVGLQARLMSQALRKIAGVAKNSNTSLIFINQLREKIGVTFGSPKTTPGGKALKFYASQRCEVIRIGTETDGAKGPKIASKVLVKVVKNKVAPPFTQAEFSIYYDLSRGQVFDADGKPVELTEEELALYTAGISAEASLIDLGEEHGIITKAGAWYSYGDDLKEQGKEKFRVALQTNPDVRAELDLKVREAVGLIGPVTAAVEDDEELPEVIETEDGTLVDANTGELIDA